MKESAVGKKEIRTDMKKRNLALAQAARAAASEKVFAQVELLEPFARARCAALFCNLADELPTGEVLSRWSISKRIVVPRVEGDVMRFYDCDPSALVRGAFGIAEPQVAARLCEPSEIDLIVVPGVAFTAHGGRLGRGRGYYDRYLSQPGMRAVKIGVCFAHQIVSEMPSEKHDVIMDYVITNH